jgi:hypothetical protein
MKKDLIKPLKREDIYRQIKQPLRKTWALDTNKNCPIRENLPKFQQFKNYYFINLIRKIKKNIIDIFYLLII